ncbi:g-patch domain-containing protein [Colletotrichum karsti]|uniref:PinX1-related protein 1 n=1 Tax=Colletotrichum karsti TaxID=1095194 RepID=A0A9P6IFR0_9PEZI|nr:g-patch domain-containing protein [Colletotrichum karsti]KAF9879726.1 g-patch domain-containing protein [Colletotrichum karsti]
MDPTKIFCDWIPLCILSHLENSHPHPRGHHSRRQTAKMGLAQQKTRRKIGKDPNNTKWTKDTDSFGQKILRSQGWEPGQYLGAKDAAHAVHHTAANASFIRVALKDDMLGLGFKQARDDRVTGMDVFGDLLSRLNGKSTEAINKDRQTRAALQTTLYCDNKFGPMRFVSGGLLVGEEIKKESEEEPKKEEDKDDVKMEDIPAAEASGKKSKKRKAEESSDDSSESSEDEKARKKRRKEEKKDKKRKSKAAKEDASDDTQENTDKKAKKDKKKDKKKADKDSDADSSDDKASKKKRRKEKSESEETDADKAARKEEKRRRKEEKRAKKEAARESSSTPATSTPASGTSTPVLRGHHAVRSRWIAQKRMATMDDKALNQIFMIKSQS